MPSPFSPPLAPWYWRRAEGSGGGGGRRHCGVVCAASVAVTRSDSAAAPGGGGAARDSFLSDGPRGSWGACRPPPGGGSCGISSGKALPLRPDDGSSPKLRAYRTRIRDTFLLGPQMAGCGPPGATGGQFRPPFARLRPWLLTPLSLPPQK